MGGRIKLAAQPIGAQDTVRRLKSVLFVGEDLALGGIAFHVGAGDGGAEG